MITASSKPTSFICKMTGENHAGNKWEGEKETTKERVKRERVRLLHKKGNSVGHKFFCR